MISIITATKSVHDMSNRAIHSIESQTNKDFEWVIVFDGCNPCEDNHISCNHAKIKQIDLGSNYGPSVARNVGFMVSNGDIIIYLDADDELSPKRIQEVSEWFDQNKDKKVLLTPYTLVQGKSSANFCPHCYLNSKQIGLANHLQKENITIPLGLAHTRDCWYAAGGFQRGIVCGEDGIFLRRVVDKLGENVVGFSHSFSGNYYIYDNGQSRTQRRFTEGGFAFDAGNAEGSNGNYLDKDWFSTYSSVKLFDKG